MTEEPQRIDLATPDVVAARRAALADLLPGVLDEGTLDVGLLADLLDLDPVTDEPERFGLRYAGRRAALQAARTRGRGALAPVALEPRPTDGSGAPAPADPGALDPGPPDPGRGDPGRVDPRQRDPGPSDRGGDSVQPAHGAEPFDGAQHVLIDGDCLEVLGLLQRAYAGRVKLIYLDPPYNTGSDFLYDDDFTDPLGRYLELTGQVDPAGNRTAAVADTAGRRHSRWLAMMHPRLVLARSLLRVDGAIAVSIDAHEDWTLRALLDEVFGAENFIAQLAVVRAEGGGMAEQVVQAHDLLLIYARSRASFPPLRRPKELRGPVVEHAGAEHWIETDWLRKEFGSYAPLHYEEIAEHRGATYLAEVDARLAAGEYRLMPTRTGRHRVGRLRPVATDGSKFTSVVKHLSRDGKARLAELGLADVFDFPKPVSLVRSLVAGATFGDPHDGAVILDLFAGSGTTGDAVLAQNAADGGNRRFVLVSLPEPVDPRSPAGRAGFATIADVTAARVAAAARALGVEPATAIRRFRLQPSSFRAATAPVDLAPTTLAEGRPHAWPDVAAEILLAEGVALDEPWHRVLVGSAHIVLAGGVAVVLAPSIAEEHVTAALALHPSVLVLPEDGLAGADTVKADAITAARLQHVTLRTV